MKTTLVCTFFALAVFIPTLSAQRVYIEDSEFRVNGQPIFFLGANTPWDKWNDFGGEFNQAFWSRHFEQLHAIGANCTRVWISCSGDNPSPGIDESGRVTPPTEAFWADVDSLFELAAKNEIYLMIALISFDHTKPGNSNAELWKKMYQDAGNRQSFVDIYAIPFVKRYGDNPYFWSIDVGNELDWVFENHGVPREDVFDLVARVANGVHANSKVLVTLGTGAGPKYLSPTIGTNFYSDVELGKLQAGAHLDFYDTHHYDWMKQWFGTPFDHGPSEWEIDDKPCLIGECAAQGHGDGYSPAECLEKAYAKGWQGVMPWTSNGVDHYGGLDQFKSAFIAFRDAHAELVAPAK